jgi:hypothetical protein
MPDLPTPTLEDPNTILVAVGALRYCEVHHAFIWETMGDVEAAYRLANTMMTREGYARHRKREVTDAIKQAFEDAPIECFDCCNPHS